MIAGEARLTLDVRHGSDEARTSGGGDSDALGGRNCGAARACPCSTTALLNQPAVAMDRALARRSEKRSDAAGCEPHQHGQRRRARRDDPGGENSRGHDFLAHAGRHQPRSGGDACEWRTWRKRSKQARICSPCLPSSPVDSKENATCIISAEREARSSRIICCLRPTRSCAPRCRA